MEYNAYNYNSELLLRVKGAGRLQGQVQNDTLMLILNVHYNNCLCFSLLVL